MRITLKAARVNAGYSQRQAAQLLKVSNKTLCKWELNKAYPNVKQVAQMCDLYRVSYNDIIFFN